MGIEGDFSYDRFTGKVRNHALVKPRQAEEKRLEELVVATSERYVLFGRFAGAAVMVALQ